MNLSGTQRIRTIVIILLLSLGLAAGAQTLLDASAHSQELWLLPTWIPGFFQNSSPLPGLLTYLLAGVVFVLGLRRLEAHQEPYPINTRPTRRAPVFGLWITSIALTILVGWRLLYPNEAPGVDNITTAAWAAAFLFLVVSVLIDEGWHPKNILSLRGWIRANRQDIYFSAFLIGAALVIRTYNLTLQPYAFINDEGEVGKVGLCILSGACNNLFVIGWAAQPIAAFLPTALSISILGNTAVAVRLVSAIWGTLAVVGVLLVGHELFDKKTAYLAAVLLAVLPLNVHFSRLGTDNIVDAITSTYILWFLLRGSRLGSPRYFLLAGIVSGLTLYTYPGSRLALGLGILLLVHIILSRRGFLKAQAKSLATYALALLITILPIGIYYLNIPQNFNARWNRESIFSSNGALGSNLHQGLLANASFITKQFFQSSLAYIATPATRGFFNSPRPYLNVIAAVFFMLGLAYVISKLPDLRYLVLFIWFWAAIIVGSTLTGAAPTSQRMLMSTPALTLIVAIGMVKYTQIFGKLGKMPYEIVPPLLILLTLAVGFIDLHYYFVNYAQGHYFEDLSNELTFESRGDVSALGTHGRLYLDAAPTTYVDFGNFKYFSPNVEMNDLENASANTLTSLPHDKDLLFIIVPAHLSDLDTIRSIYPGGNLHIVHRRYHLQVLYYAYQISESQIKAIYP